MIPVAVSLTRKERRKRKAIRASLLLLSGLALVTLLALAILSFHNYFKPSNQSNSLGSDDQIMKNLSRERAPFNWESTMLSSLLTEDKDNNSTIVSSQDEHPGDRANIFLSPTHSTPYHCAKNETVRNDSSEIPNSPLPFIFIHSIKAD